MGEGVWGCRILNFTILVGVEEKVATFISIDHLAGFCCFWGHFQNSHFSFFFFFFFFFLFFFFFFFFFLCGV